MIFNWLRVLIHIFALVSFFVSSKTVYPSYGKYNTFTQITNDIVNGVEHFSWIGSIKGRNDARVLFSPTRSMKKGIEVIFGAKGNNEIEIYDMHDGSGDFNFIAPIYHGQILSEYEYRNYWINWINGEITIGFGNQVYRNMILSYRNDALEAETNWIMPRIGNYHIRYISFSTWDMPIFYKNMVIGKGVLPLPGVFSVAANYEQFNQPNIFWLSSSFFEIVIEVQGLSDVCIGFLTTHKWKNSEDINAIEVILNDALNRQHTYPRNLIRSGTGNSGVIFAISNDTKDVLSPVEFRKFWISYYNRQMSVGYGDIIGKNKFMSTDEPLPLFPTNKVVLGFTGYFFSYAVRVLSVLSNDVDYTLMSKYTKALTSKALTPLLHKKIVPISFHYGRQKPYLPFISPKKPQECLMQCRALRLYSISLPVFARYQWWHNGAYCAEVAIQQAAMSLGNYYSQAVIRKASPYPGDATFFGDSIIGYEIIPDNIEKTLKHLDIPFTSYKKSKSQSNYFKWIKYHLVRSHPIIWYVQTTSSEYVEHAEAVFGYFSNHPLDDPEVYPDDLIQHYSGSDLLPYFRRIDSFIGKNCTYGISMGSECIPEKKQFGYALLPAQSPKLYIRISDGGKEPPPPTIINVNATIFLQKLLIGQDYRIIKKFCNTNGNTNGNTNVCKTKIVHEFLALDENYEWNDPDSFLSSFAVFYSTTGFTPITSD